MILFTNNEASSPIDRNDPRAEHLLKVLRIKVGDTFDAGVINGNMGKGRIESIDSSRLSFTLDLKSTPPPLYPITLIVGMPRPQSARDVLREATSIGVDRIVFTTVEKGEKSYRSSTLWRPDEFRRLLVQGACQAFSTRLPDVILADSIADSIEFCRDADVRIALDNYEAEHELGYIVGAVGAITATSRIAVFIGSERGWSASERRRFRDDKILIAHLGPRVLRVETACVAALSIILSHLRRQFEMDEHR